MAFNLDSRRIVVAGASSLLGAELRSLLDESLFAGWDFRLVDEELSSGIVTEVGGEAAVIQPVEEGSFSRARFVFFAGSAAFTRANLETARRSGAQIIDLSGETAGTAEVWFSKLPDLRSAPLKNSAEVFCVPSAHANGIAALALSLGRLSPKRLVAVAYQSVSEAGKSGIEELESQTGQLLSFQNIGKRAFDTQVAFNLLPRFGIGSVYALASAAGRIRVEVHAALAAKVIDPAVQLIHVPVFYGAGFSMFARLDPAATSEQLAAACKAVGFDIADSEDPASNVGAAGTTQFQITPPQKDASVAGGWWFFAAADNIRLPAWNAVKLAEKLTG